MGLAVWALRSGVLRPGKVVFRLLAPVALVMFGVLVVSPAAWACYYANGGHCYALSEWSGVSVRLTLIDAETSEASVPTQAGYHESGGIYWGPREQNEEWSVFTSPLDKSVYPGWIEAGDTTGLTAAGFRSAPAYFEASNSYYYPKWTEGAEANYTEVDFPGTGPGSGWWDATTYTEESGSWCASVEEVDLFCFPGLAKYANKVEDGLEFAANNNPEADEGWYARNQGEVIGYEENSAGEVNQWLGAHLQYADEQPGDPWPPAGAWGVCGKLNAKGQGNGAIRVEAPAWLDWGECSAGPIKWDTQAAHPASGRPIRTAANLATPDTETAKEYLAQQGAPTPTAPPPLSGYSADRNTTHISLKVAQARVAALTSQVAETTKTRSKVPLREAIAIAAPGTTAPESSPEMEEWLNGDADIIAEEGAFTLPEAPRPPAEGAPAGKYLTAIVDESTGEIAAVHLGKAKPKLW